MKQMIVILLLLWALLANQAEAQSAERDTFNANAVQLAASSATFTHLEQPNGASLTHEYEILWTGTAPPSWTVTIQGCMRGGTCATVTPWSGSTTSLGQWSGVYDYYLVTIAWPSGAPAGLTLNLSGSKYLLTPTAELSMREGALGL